MAQSAKECQSLRKKGGDKGGWMPPFEAADTLPEGQRRARKTALVNSSFVRNKKGSLIPADGSQAIFTQTVELGQSQYSDRNVRGHIRAVAVQMCGGKDSDTRSKGTKNIPYHPKTLNKVSSITKNIISHSLKSVTSLQVLQASQNYLPKNRRATRARGLQGKHGIWQAKPFRREKD